MAFTLEQFSQEAHRILAADPGPEGRKKIGAVPLVIVTHSAKESAVSGALGEIGRLETVTAPVVKIRILEEEE